MSLGPGEIRRGCGTRRVGVLYLIGEGVPHVCPTLPLRLAPCGCCGYEPKQYRDFMFVPKPYFSELKKKNPTGLECHPKCPVCYPSQNTQDKYGLMWVGKKFYTPESFIIEADEHGVSKAIKQIPKGIIFGKTWIMLAHPQGFKDLEDPDFQEKWALWSTREGEDKDHFPEPQAPTYPAIFYAFIPQRVEVLLYKSDATPEKIKDLMDRGIYVKVVADEYDAHKRQKPRGGRGVNRL